MARVVEITVPSQLTDELISALKQLDLTAGIQLQKGNSVKPTGDVITVQIPNRTMGSLLQILDESHVGTEAGTSYSISEPVALVESSVNEVLLRESTDVSWEEMHQVLARESNMTVNALALMAVSGFLTAVGVSTGALHIVIAAMVIAPGFEPLSRISLGLVAGGPALRRGLQDSGKAYLALLLGAGAAGVLLELFGKDAIASSGTYLDPASLVSYWTSVGATSLLVSLLAGIAGAIMIATDRPVLTAGVMIGLALIPAGSLIASSLVAGQFDVAGMAFVRWALDVALVMGASLLVFWWKRSTIHKRDARV